MQKATKHFPVRIYYEDTDAGGIVYYANYLRYFERARTEFLRELSINQREYLEQNIGFVVRNVEMQNIASARLDDLLSVATVIKELKRASVIFEQVITDQQNKKICTAVVRVACVDLSMSKPCPIPDPILGAFSRVS